MTLDSAAHIGDFDTSKPNGSDPKAEGDDNFRQIKTALKTDFPNIKGPVSATHTELSYVAGVTSALQPQIDAKGAKAGQVWTGAHDYTGATITVPTQALSDSSTKPASTAFVASMVFAAALPELTSSSQDKPITNNGSVYRVDDPGLTAQTFYFTSF